MKVLGLSCNHCGAPIEVGIRAKFATCAYCDSRLRIVRTSSAAHTEVLEAMGKRINRISADVEALRLQDEIADLDRQWTELRAEYGVPGQEGRYAVPSRRNAVITMLGMAFFAVVWTVATIVLDAPPAAPLVGVVVLLLAVIVGFAGVGRAREYERGYSVYSERRSRLVDALDALPG